ncbi:hypothetical protein Nepgr_016691 [Nepenthes gracilis]|uniref:Uncharacterized protein n=1 Tax=Nepenthes gracilis TaxID=150966 RepID=A0AAD3XSQ3_NEPGR|nr:hypothetical protein Nepgr_016691 [Nepenthes gracilis]
MSWARTGGQIIGLHGEEGIFSWTADAFPADNPNCRLVHEARVLRVLRRLHTGGKKETDQLISQVQILSEKVVAGPERNNRYVIKYTPRRPAFGLSQFSGGLINQASKNDLPGRNKSHSSF